MARREQMSTNMPTPSTVETHLATARRKLAMALHYHRHFGHPLAAFSDDHNASRKERNDRAVAAFATEAGQYARFAGEHWESLSAVLPAAWAIAAIRAAARVGWEATDRDLADDDAQLPEVAL